jgi:hypothetical protein
MDNERLVRNWHKGIIKECQKRLGRNLTGEEEVFIRSRGGFIALEIIEDTVKGLIGKELEKYLNSETKNKSSNNAVQARFGKKGRPC